MTNGVNPWRPGALIDREDIGEFLYVVVEEEIDDMVGLVVAPWPAGSDDRPRFDDEVDDLEVVVDRDALHSHLRQFRQVPAVEEIPAEEGRPIPPEAEEDLRTRQVNVGDVFAVRPLTPPTPESDPEVLRSCDWMGETIDITAEAREAAKAAMYEALTPPLDPQVAEEILVEADERATEPGGA